MKKRLILIGGPMGVGKSCASQALARLLPKNVLLDGDWCWNMRPFVVSDETRRMVMENIRFLLNQFLRCSTIENLIFCWVMHRQEIIDELLDGLNVEGVEVWKFSLVADAETLTARIAGDVQRGLRDAGALERSMAYLKGYAALDTRKLDVSHLTPDQTAARIAAMIGT